MRTAPSGKTRLIVTVIAINVAAAMTFVASLLANEMAGQAPTADVDAQIKKLEARVAAIERQLANNEGLVVTAPFAVVDKTGKSTLLHVTGDATGASVTLGDGGTQIALNAWKGAGSSLSVAAEGQPEVRLVSTSSNAGIDVNAMASARIGEKTSQRLAFLGQTDDADASSVLMLNSAAGTSMAGLSAESDGGHFQLAGDNETVGAELSVGKEGGALRIMGKTGAPVGGLFSTSAGGRIALTAVGSEYSAVSLGVAGDGGSVRVFSKSGGPARASLEASGPSAGVTAYDSKGNPAATLSTVSSGSGILQLLNDGVTMLEAGTTEDSVGLLRVGPVCGGVLGNFAQPCMVLGRKGK